MRSEAQRDGLVRDQHFAQVPAWVVAHPDLSAGAVRLYAALWLHADWSTGGGAYPGRRRLGALLSVSEKQISRYLRELETAGALVTTLRPNQTSLYRLVSVCGQPGPGGHPCPSDVDTGVQGYGHTRPGPLPTDVPRTKPNNKTSNQNGFDGFETDMSPGPLTPEQVEERWLQQMGLRQ